MSADPGLLLAIDTSTRRTSVALGDGDSVRGFRSVDREAGELLDLVAALLTGARLERYSLGGIVVGTGPGSFTGLRVGLATAKTLAHTLDVPLLGVPTVEALAHAAARHQARPQDGSGQVSGGQPAAKGVRGGGTLLVVLAAGARDHYMARVQDPGGQARLACSVELLAPGASLPYPVGGDSVMTVEIASAPLGPEAAARGRDALDGLAQALLALGHQRFLAGERADPATLVPAYVALPRGIPLAAGETWSPDLR